MRADIQANFDKVVIGNNKVAMQFTLSPLSESRIPVLSELCGKTVFMGIDDGQEPLPGIPSATTEAEHVQMEMPVEAEDVEPEGPDVYRTL